MDFQLKDRTQEKIKEPLKTKSGEVPKKSWTIESIQTLSSKYSALCKNLENWMETPQESSQNQSSIEANMLHFQENTGIESLHELTPGLSYSEAPESLSYFIRSLTPYYLSGFLFERGQQQENWWITGFFFKGQWFDLELSDQIQLTHKLPRMSPLQVKKASTEKLLERYKIDFVPIPVTAQSFLFRPTHITGLLLMTESPEIFARVKIEAGLKLINRYFNP